MKVLFENHFSLRNFNKLKYKYQTSPNTSKIDAFEQKIYQSSGK